MQRLQLLKARHYDILIFLPLRWLYITLWIGSKGVTFGDVLLSKCNLPFPHDLNSQILLLKILLAQFNLKAFIVKSVQKVVKILNLLGTWLDFLFEGGDVVFVLGQRRSLTRFWLLVWRMFRQHLLVVHLLLVRHGLTPLVELGLLKLLLVLKLELSLAGLSFLANLLLPLIHVAWLRLLH